MATPESDKPRSSTTRRWNTRLFSFLVCLPVDLLLEFSLANELTTSLAAAYEDAKGKKDSFDFSNLLVTLATAQCHHTEQLVTTSEVAVNLGPVSGTLGVLILCNLDSTNYIEVRTATGSTKFAKLFPKVTSGAAGLPFCIIQVGSGVTAPFVIANSASCWMEILLCCL